MRKLKKNFSEQNRTVEAMVDTCDFGCVCGVVSCPCGSNVSTQYSTFNTQQTNDKNAFKNGQY